ncbi:MAG: RNA-directed DNA polymerase [Bacteroidia bacterium]|jgi:retron-type reverse transcriptase
MNNLVLADKKARKGKSDQYGVKIHDRQRGCNLIRLQNMLIDKTYSTSGYTTFKVYEPKEREVYRLPFFPDRIVHHAIMNILESVFVASFTADTFSCIKGRGIHAASFAVRRALRDEVQTRYCLKIDIKKYYPNVDHQVLKVLIRRKIKDKDLLWLLDEIIDSAPGLPIGNYLSQYFANFYLSGMDHWIKEQLGVKHYFRYLDDMVFFSADKDSLHKILEKVKAYTAHQLKLSLKENYQVFPVQARGVDFVGYVHYHIHTSLRKSIKQRFARMLKSNRTRASIASYNGWIQHCDGRNLFNTLTHGR